ncbi:MAG TPA: hypothetical protein VMW37_04150 [Dehalococcoidales bacterium]|nr:hypothetical protein [Dehalococcoidales bacterium]
MVKEVKRNNQTVYVCEACGFAYEEKYWAEKCQDWCEQNHSCNLEITQHAVAMKTED